MFWLLDRLFDNVRLRDWYNTFLSPYLATILWFSHVLVILFSLLFALGGLCRLAFFIEQTEIKVTLDILTGLTYYVFLFDRLLCLMLDPERFRKRYKLSGHLLNGALFLSWLSPMPEDTHIKFILVGVLAVMDLSHWFVGLLSKRISPSPSLILSLSFLLLITLGTVLLMSPRSLADGQTLPFVDACFVATSSVCVTGLSTIDVATTFSHTGQLVLLMLIQIGGLGVMTITSFFALLMMGNTSVFNQLVIRDLVSGDSISSLLSMLLHILGFTFIIEGSGAFLIWMSLGEVQVSDPVFFCIFHSISAFCNAGFSTLPDGLSNDMFLKDQMNAFYLALCLLIILGSIGYPLLVNIKESIVYYIKWILYRGRRRFSYKKTHLLGINTKVVAVTTVLLLVSGTALMAFLEWDGALAQFSVAGKLTHAFFNATSPRTTGFSSVPLTSFGTQAIIVYLLLMWIGGAAQSTAGGIKVNVFALAFKSFWATLKGVPDVVMFRRKVADISIRRANATVLVSLSCIFIAFGILTWLEPHLSKWGLFFEVVSAISTVGSTLDITSKLADASKLVVMVLMFCGRVGLFTLLMSFIRQHVGARYLYPEEEMLIG